MKHDSLEVIFSLEELKEFFRAKKRFLYRVFFAGSFLFLAFSLITPIQYKVTASFLEKEGEGEGQDSLKTLFLGKSSLQEGSSAASLMKSKKVLKALMEKEGLQIFQVKRGLLGKVFHNLQENLRFAFFGKVDDIENFSFSDVAFEGECPLLFSLQFLPKGEFFVFSSEGKKLGVGKVGVPFSFSSFSFTVKAHPKEILVKKRYSFQVVPWQDLFEDLGKSISIKKERENPNLLLLSIQKRDRKEGARILNGLMREYKNHEEKEREETSSEQITYLLRRQKEVEESFSKGLQEYETYLKERIENAGFLSTEEEITAFSKQYQKQTETLLETEALEKQLSSCHSFEEVGSFLGKVNPEIVELYKEKEKTIEEKEKIELSLRLQDLEKSEFIQQKTEKHLTDLKKVNTTIENLEKAEGIHFFQEANRGGEFFAKKEDFASYKKELLKQLKAEKVVLEKRISLEENLPKELEGIDLKTAKEFLTSYHIKTDALQEKIRQLSFALENIEKPSFEVSSLSGVLQDPVSQERVHRLSSLSMQRKEDKFLTEKEKIRIEEDIALQKKILQVHIESVIRMEAISLELIKQKQKMLQQIILDCLEQSLALLQEKGRELLFRQKEEVKKEKEVLLEKIAVLKEKMKEIPQNQRKEERLFLQKELGTKITQAILELIENKTIASNLKRFQSRPLDQASVPIKAMPKLYLLKAILVGLVLVFFTFLASFVAALLKGLPPSSRSLKLLDQKFLGEISLRSEEEDLNSLSDADLEALREAVFFINEGKIISFFNPTGPNYLFSLAKLFQKKGEKVLVVNCDLQSPYKKKEERGLLTVLEGNNNSIERVCIKTEGVDYLPSGGSTRFSIELFTSEVFSCFLEEAKKKYDKIFLSSRFSLSFLESTVFLSFSDRVVITLEKEPIEVLQPFMDWSYDEGRGKLAFLKKGTGFYGKA